VREGGRPTGKMEGAREKKKGVGGGEGGEEASWRSWQLQDVSTSLRRLAGGGNGELQEASTQELPVTHEEDNRLFAKSPLGIGDSMGCLKQP
jgi:hypothetical protein